MRERLFIVETSSAHLRELLREACASIAAATVFASTRAATTAIAEAPPIALVIGGAPLEQSALDLMHDAVRRGCTALAFVNAPDLLRAQQLGALEGFSRDSSGIEKLANRLRAILAQRQSSLRAQPRESMPSELAARIPLTSQRPAAARTTPLRLIAIGASTGGPDAIAYLVSRLPAHLPGIVIVQHMPATHTGAFAQRLDGESAWRVREAHDGDAIEPGLVLIAPGGQHLRVQRGGAHVALSRQPQAAHMPSVDVLFESVAAELTISALGILLTGMGSDGAQGLLSMRRTGAYTIVQSEASCAVYGMPRRAVELDAAIESVELGDLPERVTALAAPRGL